MTDDDRTPENGSTNGSTDETTDLAAHLDALADGIAADLHDLADAVEAGEDVDEERVENARAQLLEADRTARRDLGGLAERDLEDVERDPREREIPAFEDVYDVERLRDAPVEEVAEMFEAEVLATREVADRVDRHLVAGQLSDVDVEDLWDRSLRLRGWAAKVLTFRTDREVLLTAEEARAREDGDAADNGGNHA